MSTPNTRRRVNTVWLGLVVAVMLAFAGTSPHAAQAQAPIPSPTPQRNTASPVETTGDVGPIAEAYLLLVDHYAVPLDPAQLVAAGQDGMEVVLRAAGVDVSSVDPATYGTTVVEEFAVLQSQYQALVARYGNVVSPQALAHAAIKSMADSVGDAHTTFLSPEEFQEEQRWESGQERYAGIGVRMRGPQATVLEVFPGTPAERAGLQPGDMILAVNGQSTSDLKLDEIVKLVRGPVGTTVALNVQRAGGSRVETVTLVRADVSAPFVSARELPGNLGYVQLRGFPDASVAIEVEHHILQQQRAGVRGIVLDLRGNSGGRLAVGERLLADFVPDGPIYQSVDRDGHRDVRNIHGAHPILTVPLAVLVDDGTASMGEIFAAAIQEHHLGRVIGNTTAGAVAASRIIPLSDGSALQLSVEQVFTGLGAPLDRVGVHPDEEVALDLNALRQGRDTQLEQATSDLLAAPAR